MYVPYLTARSTAVAFRSISNRFKSTSLDAKKILGKNLTDNVIESIIDYY